MQQEKYTPEDLPIYSHGFHVRLRLCLPKQEALERLRGIGYASVPNRAWKACGTDTLALKGSTRLTNRAPLARRGESRSVLQERNRKWRTRLYSVAVDERDVAVFLELQGVRQEDIGRFCEGVLALGKVEYELAYYRRLERYVVLSPPDAHRLASALRHLDQGPKPKPELEMLVREIQFSTTVRRRARSMLRVKLYRVRPGGTAPFRLEAWLQGCASDRTQFFLEDGAVLDDQLRALVVEHGLRPIEKPARWEPEDENVAPRDPDFACLPYRVYRGAKAAGERLAKCHPPCAVNSGVNLLLQAVAPQIGRTHRVSDGEIGKQEGGEGGGPQEDNVGQPHPRRGAAAVPGDLLHAWARYERYLGLHSVAFPSRPVPAPTPTSKSLARAPWAEVLARRIRSLPDGFIAEVVLDPCRDPTTLLEALLDAQGADDVGFAYLGIGDDMWQGMAELMARHRRPEAPRVAVLVVDPDAACLLAGDWQAHENDALAKGLPGEACEHAVVAVPRTQASMFWRVLEAATAAFERDGGKLVLISADARPIHGRGRLLGEHFRSDARVRSTLGGAGRYWAHVRYLVEGTPEPRVVMTKDFEHGKVGQVLYDHGVELGLCDGDDLVDVEVLLDGMGIVTSGLDDNLLVEEVPDALDDDFADILDGVPEPDLDAESDATIIVPDEDELLEALNETIAAL